MRHPVPDADSIDFYEAALVKLIEAVVSRSGPLEIALQQSEAELARLEARARSEVDRP
jgi:hypothetical protein